MAYSAPHTRTPVRLESYAAQTSSNPNRPSSSSYSPSAPPYPPYAPPPTVPQRPQSYNAASTVAPKSYGSSASPSRATVSAYPQPLHEQMGGLRLEYDPTRPIPLSGNGYGAHGAPVANGWDHGQATSSSGGPSRHLYRGQPVDEASLSLTTPHRPAPQPNHYTESDHVPATPLNIHPPQYTAYPSAATPPQMTHAPRTLPPPSNAPPSSAGLQPPLVAPTPTVDALRAILPSLDSQSDFDRLFFAQDVLRVLDRHLYPSGSPTDFISPESTPSAARLPEALDSLLNVAIPIIISFTSHQSTQISSLANYLRGKLLASGACPDFLPRDRRQAFKDFETAARGGDARGWFRLGRDYEGVGDLGRARECFERGRSRGDCESTYRMGMANLLGQLHLSPDPAVALPLLRAASESTNIDFPQPSYVYGMLLAGELSTPTPIPPHLLLPPSSSPTEALLSQHAASRDAIERAAYLGLAPAQHKLGYLSEHAALGATYDPLVSVQWYSLASQGGEVEADMELSKWFLCGADGHFGKNEELARTFAEKAARKGHPNGCFAMGYYFELGIGGRQDRDQAKKWYQRAAKLQNPDAIQRLAALSAPQPQQMTLSEHQSRLNDTLVRRHTQAKIRSDRHSTRQGAAGPPRESSRAQARVDAARIAAAAAAAMPVPVPAAPMSPAAASGGYGNGVIPPGPISRSRSPGMPTNISTPRPPGAYPQPHPYEQQQQQQQPSSQQLQPDSDYRPRRSSRPQIEITIPSAPAASAPIQQARPMRPSASTPQIVTTPPSNSGSMPVRGSHRDSPSSASASTPKAIPSNQTQTQPKAQPQPQRGYILHDSLVPTLPPPESFPGDPGPKKKGPQTFAEMGFVSKPVQDEGCSIM